jgi:hypothetical protein
MDAVWQAILNDALPVLSVFVKGIVAAVVVGGLAQLTVEYLIGPAAASDETPGWVTFLSQGAPKRMATLLIAQGCCLAAHGFDVWSFGDGERGWGAAWLFGFLGGGLMPWVHDQIRSRISGAKP